MSSELFAVGGRPLGMHPTPTLAWPTPALPAVTEVAVTSVTASHFDDFFRQRYERTVRVGYLMLGDRLTAEDVVQDAFARLELRWTKLDAPGTYLYRLVVDGSRDVLRRRRLAALVGRRRRLASADELAVALANLPAKRRAAVVLHFYDGLGEDEIADVLGVRPRTVEAMLQRAVAQLREVIER